MLQTIIDLFNYLFKKTPTVAATTKTLPNVEVGLFRATLNELVTKPLFAPTIVNGQATVTHCNQFVNEVCSTLFGYEKFKDKMANEMVQYMRTNPQEWRELPQIDWEYQGNKGHGLNWSHVTDLAMNGHLVVLGITEQQHGHVNIVAPEVCSYSPNFHRPVSAVANVGRSNFYGKAASFAFVVTNPPTAFLFVGNS